MEYSGTVVKEKEIGRRGVAGGGGGGGELGNVVHK